MADIAAGQSYRIKEQYGNSENSDGSPGDPILAGTVGVVSRFVPEADPGAAHHEGDSWVLDFPKEGGSGEGIVQVARSIAFSPNDIATGFELVEG